ncbi:hypothetical protein SAMN04487989_10322, partial [Bizionia echini]
MATAALGHPPLSLLRFLFVLLRKRNVGRLSVLLHAFQLLNYGLFSSGTHDVLCG